MFGFNLQTVGTMPEKITFHVVHASGQDENLRATELNTHSPLTRGWSSSRYISSLLIWG